MNEDAFQNLDDPVPPYKLVENKAGAQAVLLSGAPFKGYVIRFGKVTLNEITDEPDGGATLHIDYDYELLKGKEPVRSDRKQKLTEYMGAVVRDLIIRAIKENTIPLSTDKPGEFADE